MTGRVVVVGLGPGDPKLLSAAAAEAITAIPHRYLRTTRHPSAGVVGQATSFDELYERAATVEEVYHGIVATLATAAAEHGEVLYAVPGSPLVAERTVELLRAEPALDIEVVPALSFLDLAWARLGVDPVRAGARLVDGHRFAAEAAGQTGPLLVGQCDTVGVLSDIKLALDDAEAVPLPEVTVLQRLGLPDERVVTVPAAELDRRVAPDHLTTVWIPALAAPVAAEVVRLEELVRILRERCPWDRAQTHASLTRHLVEEAYEVLDAIDELPAAAGGAGATGGAAGAGAAMPDGAAYEHLEEELGDLLFQVAFHARLAAEAGQFTLADVARGVHDKLVGRHPHVFGPPGEPVPDWEQRKREEKGRASVMDGVPASLPALLLAHKVQRAAAAVGFDWPSAAEAWPKVREELDELAEAVAAGRRPDAEEELGDLLFSVVNVARHLGVDPEATLRRATAKFRRRFAAVEALAAARGLTPAAYDALWDEVKAAGPPPA